MNWLTELRTRWLYIVLPTLAVVVTLIGLVNFGMWGFIVGLLLLSLWPYAWNTDSRLSAFLVGIITGEILILAVAVLLYLL